MKLTEEDKADLQGMTGDWEQFHVHRDYLMKKRLSELDAEFMEDLEEECRDATFWYA